MPYAALRPCSAPGCPALVPSGRCPQHQRQHYRRDTQQRGTARERGYSRAWQQARLIWLAAHPLCADPFGTHGPILVTASVVDHIVPHRGDAATFWRHDNLQSLCKACHDRKTVREDGGFGCVTVER